MIYGNPPEIISQREIEVEEMMFYQYFPILVDGNFSCISIEPRHLVFQPLIEDALAYECYAKKNHFKFVYLTVKNTFALPGNNINRDGWHSDGFMTQDINYIWSNKLPTEYTLGAWKLHDQIPADDSKSLAAFEYFAEEGKIISCSPNTLYRLDESVIHRQIPNNTDRAILRCFFKLTFSNMEFNLRGYSKNYYLNFPISARFEMDPDSKRNMPHKKQ